jgi:hypothetical protein
MTRTVKNLTIPFSCRKTTARQNFGSLSSVSLSSLGSFVGAPKSEQLLCCYNLKANKYMDKTVKKFRCEWGEKASDQTVVVLDFDGAGSASYLISSVRDAFRRSTRFSPIMVESFSGFHAIIPLGFKVESDELFSRIVTEFVNVVPDYLRVNVDKYSYNRTWCWYHSQHFANWVEKGIINISKSDQEDNGVFFAESLDTSLMVEFWMKMAHSTFSNLPEKSNAYLIDLFKILTQCLQRTEYEPNIVKAATVFIRRILVETGRRGNPGEILSALRAGKAAIQHKAEGDVFKSELNAAVREIEGLCGLDEEVADRVERGGSHRDESNDRGGAQETPVLRVESNPEEGDGNRIGRSGWHEEFAKRGLPGYRSVECVLAVVSELSSLLRRQQLDFDRMGNVVPEDRVREHQYRRDESEEQNYIVFHGVCGQVLEKYSGQSGVTPAAHVSLYEWFRHASRYMGNRKHDGRILREFANQIARGIRLSDTCVRGGGFQEVRKQENTKLSYGETSHLEEFVAELFEDGWQTRIMSDRYAKRLESFYRLHKDRFMSGLSQMFGFFCRLRSEIEHNGSLDVGVEHFVHWFGSLELASYLRRLILPMISITNNKYRVNYKTKTWWFTEVFKQKWLSRFEGMVAKFEELDVISFAKKLGNGNTFETLRAGVVKVFVRAKNCANSAAEFLHRALDASVANDKPQRHKEIDSYLRKITKYNNIMAKAA